MKKIFITLFCVFIGCSMFAQTTLPFVSHKVVHADPVQFTPPRINQGSLYDPLGNLGGGTTRQNNKVKHWYTADAVLIANEDGEGEWEETSIRVLQEGLDVTVFASETHKMSSVSSEYTKNVDDEGNTSLIWKCVDNKGRRCVVSVEFFDSSLFLIIEFQKFQVIYHLIPDD